MRPTFLGFETASRGLAASQKRIDITGNNLTNIQTEGYTRQRVDCVSMTMNSNSRFASNKANLAGQGVNINGVSQTRDAFLDKRFRDEYSDVGYYDQAVAIQEDIESALDEVSASGMKDAITKFTNALQELSKHADQPTYANIVLTTAKGMTKVLNQFNTKLNNIMEQQKFNTKTSIQEVNSSLERIAAINESISKDVFLSGASTSEYYGPNELMDERNLLLDKLAKYGEVRILENADKTVNVEMNGHMVVQGSKSEAMSFNSNEDNTISINWQSTGAPVNITTGSLKASLDMINGRGTAATTANESFEQGIPYYKDKINALAKAIAKECNNTIPTVDASGTPTGEFKALFASTDGEAINAGNIAVSNTWNETPGYIINQVKKDGAIDNSSVTTLINKFSIDVDFGDFKGTFAKYVDFYNTTIGEQKTFNEGRLDATSLIADEMLNRRDEVSGVSQDEEGSNLLLYQKSYNAIARVMTTMDEILDTLISKTGLVGR